MRLTSAEITEIEHAFEKMEERSMEVYNSMREELGHARMDATSYLGMIEFVKSRHAEIVSKLREDLPCA